MSLSGASNAVLDCFSPKPLCVFPSSKYLFARNDRRPKFLLLRHFSATSFRFQSRSSIRPHIDVRRLRIDCCDASSSSSPKPVGKETESAQQPFELNSIKLKKAFPRWSMNLKEAERERINRLEEFERKANVQLERQLMMASEWSRALLTMRGKLKGTEWDPESSHCIDYSDFKRLLDSNNVQFMEYSNYGQSVSVILPYYKDGKTEGSEVDGNNEIVFRRHVVDRMPIDCWNDVWRKLHQQIVNVDVHNVNTVHAEVYSTVAIAVVWSMRLALSVALYVWIDNMMRPIYGKLIPCDLGAPPKKMTLQPLKRQALGSLGKSRAKFISAEEKTGVTFDDFAGQEYIKRELQEIVKILKNEEEYQKKGIYCPKGVLLHGPPGTGKTLLAKAIAGEAGLPFFAANGTDFVEVSNCNAEFSLIMRRGFGKRKKVSDSVSSTYKMFVGVAASRVKDLFASARSFAPSIIFIDEIDAIGSKRGGPDIGGGGAEREQGLLQILTEMDGFKVSTSQVLVIGATNRLDILDPALLRKGRFDKIIRVGLPSKDGRFAILKVHARNKYFRSEEEKETLLQEIADVTDDFTGAELQNILNEAGILTARKDLDYIGQEELLEALKRQKGTFETGQEDSTEVPEELKLRLAYREAAVAVLACYIPDPYRPFIDTDINSINGQPNMRYQVTSGWVVQRKADYVDSIVRACALDGESDEEDDDFVFSKEDGLTYRDVAKASGAGEPLYNSRSNNSRGNKKGKNTIESSSKGRLIDESEDEEDEIEFDETDTNPYHDSQDEDFENLQEEPDEDDARVIEEEIFGVDNLCWISAKATLEASSRAEFLILQTGMTAFGKAYYQYQNDLVPNLAAKLEALREEYMRFAVEKCSSVLREYRPAVEIITDVLLEKREIKADEIWKIHNNSPRIPQPAVKGVDEYGVLIYAGRWGIHGVSLPGRVTFAPGNVGFSTFGAPRPMETQIISDDTWKLVDGIWDKKVQKIRAEVSMEIEEENPQLLMASHFL
ncbi:putative inactive ATP-dependent zinc metalloprotease FTSHI 4, chloroplastic [Orobanche hederae]